MIDDEEPMHLDDPEFDRDHEGPQMRPAKRNLPDYTGLPEPVASWNSHNHHFDTFEAQQVNPIAHVRYEVSQNEQNRQLVVNFPRGFTPDVNGPVDNLSREYRELANSPLEGIKIDYPVNQQKITIKAELTREENPQQTLTRLLDIAQLPEFIKSAVMSNYEERNQTPDEKATAGDIKTNTAKKSNSPNTNG